MLTNIIQKYKTLLFLLSFMLLIPAFYTKAKTIQNRNCPKIFCNNPTYNFGVRNSKTNVFHKFLIKNNGNIPLLIKRIRTCCGAKVETTTKNILPGKSTVINVKLPLNQFNGKLNRVIYIESNDTEKPIYKLSLTGVVNKTIYAQPEKICLNSFALNQILSTNITLWHKFGDSFSITNLIISDNINNVKVDTNKYSYKINFEITSSMNGMFKEEICVYTDNYVYITVHK